MTVTHLSLVNLSLRHHVMQPECDVVIAPGVTHIMEEMVSGNELLSLDKMGFLYYAVIPESILSMTEEISALSLLYRRLHHSLNGVPMVTPPLLCFFVSVVAKLKSILFLIGPLVCITC